MDRHASGSARKIAEVFSSSASRKTSGGRFSLEEVESMDRKKYPIKAEDYVLYEEVGQGGCASVHRALCVPLNEVVAIKILDFERSNSDLSNISREAQTMILVDHPNVLKAYCSFVHEHSLWVVMPYMAGGSCLHILKAAFPDGFGETVIATVLREVLKGLEYLHDHGHIHRDVKAGNILIGSRGAIKLGDFGVSACLFDTGDRQRARNTFVGTPCWMAPEVMEQLHGYDFKADIWSFGITALELAHGHAPFSKYPPMKVLLMTLQNAPPGLDYERDRKFSKSFKQMIAMCLVKDPSKRPSAQKLLKHPFFKQARSNDYIARTLLEGLPDLGDRLRVLKLKEADLVAQKKMPDGKKEELSQNEYKRGISGWDFNIEDMKAQASLIQDVDETMPENEQGGSSNCLFGLDVIPDKQSQCPLPIPLKDDRREKEDEDEMRINPVAPLSPGSTATDLMYSCGETEELSLAVGTRKPVILQDSVVPHANGELDPNENHPEVDEMNSKSIATHYSHERKVPSDPCAAAGPIPVACKVESKQQPQIQIAGTSNIADDSHSEASQKGPKLTASISDAEEKSKGPVVQQRGRFKVTSENVELEKPLPSPVLQKSHSLQDGTTQVIPPVPAISLSSSSDASVSNHLGCTLTPQLHNMLQTINSLRDNFVGLMKQVDNGQVSSGDLSASRVAEGASTPVSTSATDKPLPEAAHEREKELLQEITDLNWRLVCAQDELQKLRSKTTQV